MKTDEVCRAVKIQVTVFSVVTVCSDAVSQPQRLQIEGVYEENECDELVTILWN
jgi:hypothetical protein